MSRLQPWIGPADAVPRTAAAAGSPTAFQTDPDYATLDDRTRATLDALATAVADLAADYPADTVITVDARRDDDASTTVRITVPPPQTAAPVTAPTDPQGA